jgi:energy-coupling factor transporter ATP-binding protein EcfA2
LEVPDLKAWCLERPDERRSLVVAGTEVSFSAAEVLTGYVDAVFARVGIKGDAVHQISALMPALAAHQNRQRYQDMLVKAVQAACEHSIVNTLTESEMVLEYFHLFKRTLRLKREVTGVFLVVDSGAATTNFTIVLSTKSGRITQAAKAIRPPQLRPVSADAPLAGGALIDTWLLERAGINQIGPGSAARTAALSSLERAKIAVSRGEDSAIASLPGGRVFTVTRALLVDAAKHLWSRLRPTYLEVAERLLMQLTTGAKASAYKAMLEEKRVSRADDVARLFHAVFTAGGTSLLPGFRECLIDAIGAAADLSVHPIGGAYPVAAAVGAIAHLTTSEDAVRSPTPEADESASGRLQATLPWDVYLLAADDKLGTPSKPNWIKVLDRQDELISEGGERNITLPSSWSQGMRPKVRLVPGTSDDLTMSTDLRRKIKSRMLHVTTSSPRASLVVDAEREVASLASADIRGVEQIRLSLSARADHTHRANHGSGHSIVIDIGMSKTVLARANSAQPAPNAFEEAHGWVPNHPGFNLIGPISIASGRPLDGGGYSPLEILDPVTRIEHVIAQAARDHIHTDASLLALAYLGICTRRFVMLAGPPGSGKSTVARLLAQVLGCESGTSFFDLPVQSHWIDDGPLFGPQGVLRTALGATSLSLVLFDELNLARPEYYLQRIFGALDHHDTIDSQSTRGLCIIGTLNVDEVSRPPSPKVLDRAMLFYVHPSQPQVQRMAFSAWHPRTTASKTDRPARHVGAGILPGEPTEEATLLVNRWVQVAHSVAEQHPRLRPDVIPTYRARNDLLCFAALHRTFGFEKLVSARNALDNAFLGRLIAPLNGPDFEVLPLIEAWLPLAKGADGLLPLPLVQRRLEKLKSQAQEHSYVSFWQ